MDWTRWWNLLHQKVGGVSTDWCQFAFWHLNLVELPPCVSRTVSHVIKHKDPPCPCSPEGPSVFLQFYHCDDLVVLKDLYRPLLFPSSQSYSGWGWWNFSDAELANVFDLPLWLQKDAPALSFWKSRLMGPGFTPLKLPSALLTDLVPHLERLIDPSHTPGFGSNDLVAATATDDSEVVPMELEGDAQLSQAFAALDVNESEFESSFLPSIQQHLPHLWIDDSFVTSGAVKHDDAAAPYPLWDQRIQLAFDSFTPSVLNCLRAFAHLWWCWHTYGSFRRYLTSVYGEDWLKLFTTCAIWIGFLRFLFSRSCSICGNADAFGVSPFKRGGYFITCFP